MPQSSNSLANDLTQRPLADLAQLMDQGRLTATALTQACLDRIAQEDAALHAFIEIYAEEALQTAGALDAERAAGKVRGPLHGIPIAIKDLADIAGKVTTFGSQVYGTAPATKTAPFVQNLIDAGMIIMGKVHMVEFALGSWGANQSLGTPINPHDRETQRVAGGSSSGSAVAVASGMVPCAIGSDTGGSIRIPSALCGIVGLKTSGNVVNRDGVAPLSQTLDTIGPMANTVDDTRLILQALTGAEYTPAPTELNQIRAGVLGACQLEPLDPEIEDAFIEVLSILQSEGVTTQTLTLPLPPPEYQHLNGAIMNYEGYHNVKHLVDDYTKPMDPFVRTRMLNGRTISQAVYFDAITERKTAVESFQNQIADLDVIILPTTAIPATPVSEVDESFMPMSRFTRWGSYLDLCGVSLPMGKTHNGLPMGLQILSRSGNERDLLNFAAAVEKLLA